MINLELTSISAAGAAATAIGTLVCSSTTVTFSPLTALPAPISPTPTLTVAGIPIVGAITSSVCSTDAAVSSVSVSKNGNCAILSGTVNQTINFSAIPGTLPAAAISSIATTIVTDLLSSISTCTGDITGTAGTPIGTLATVVTALTGNSAPTVATLYSYLLDTLPSVLATSLTTQFAVEPISSTATVPAFTFALSVSDSSIGCLSKCEKLCAAADVCFVSAAGASLTPTTTSFPLSVTSSCALFPTSTITDLTTTDFIASSTSIPGVTTLPNLFCANTASGCVVVAPALIITDRIDATIDHGKACCNLKSCPVTATNLPASSTSGFSPLGFSTFSSIFRIPI